MFLGSFEHSLDAKGRVSLPVRFREALSSNGEGRLVLTTNVDPGARCLVAYPNPQWQAFQERLADLPQFDPDVIQLKRLLIGGACEVNLDRQGRILIPPTQREYACLEGSVMFAGLGPTVELWDRKLWEEQRTRAQESLPRINDAVSRLGL
jgi:MraZ protein